MNLLITGNLGYVGSVAVAALRQAFPDGRLAGLDCGYFAHALTARQPLPERVLDVQHFADVRQIGPQHLAGVDGVIHLAAISNDPMANAFETLTDEVNHQASVRLARLARDAGVRTFVFASSCSVYGFAEGAPRSERSELNPLTAYARSKIDTETGLASLADDTFTVTCLRFPTACGMSDRLRLDLVLNDFVASAVCAGEIRILSDGTPWRPLIDVQDMARAMAWALTRPREAGGAFLAINVGRNAWNYQIRDLAGAVQAELPGVTVHINPEAQPDRRSYRVDFSLYAELAPDHLPQVDLARSIRELHSGLQAIGFDAAARRRTPLIRLEMLGGHQHSRRLNERLEWVRP